MKRFASFVIVFLLTGFALTSCDKDDTSPGGGTGNGLKILYPTKMTFFEGNNSAYPTQWKFTYDAKNNLTFWGQDDGIFHEVSEHAVTVGAYASSDIYWRSYVFTLANVTDSSVSIYTGKPTQVRTTQFHKNLTSGGTDSQPLNLAYWTYYSNGLLQKEISTAGGGLNINYSYDAKGNLSQISWVNLSGPRAGAEYARLRVISLDDHPSPFVAIKGWSVASYPSSYPDEYGRSLCVNNPIQVITEDYDVASNSWKPYEQDDMTYVYNEQGYPTTINLTRTYTTGTGTTKYTKTFNFTYRE